MMHESPQHLLTIAQAADSTESPLPAASLLLGLAGALAALLIGLLLLRLARGTLVRKGRSTRARGADRPEPVDAWDEAGRRLATPPAEDPGDEAPNGRFG
jgi:hypothetical protein